MTADTIVAPGWAPGPEVIAAEQAVVGAAIQSRTSVEAAAEIVRPGDFHLPHHRLAFAAALELAEAGDPVDPAAVLKVLAAAGDLQRVGGGPGLHTLMQWAVVGPAVTYHARIVAADARRRRLHEAGQQIVQVASGAGFDADADPDLARKLLDEALADTGDTGQAAAAADLITQVLDELESGKDEAGLPTGYRDLDAMLAGLRPGQLVVVGARPKVGKSTVGVDIARHVGIRLQLPSLLVSLEMSKTDVMHRLIAAEGRVDLHRLQHRDLNADDWSRISRATTRIAEGRLLIDDTPECGLAHIRARLRGMRRTGGCSLVVVDYLQLLKGGQKAENRQVQVAELSRGLKLIAREYEVPVVVLAQLNRGSEHRQDKRPVPSDLRESGAVEQDADVVLLLHREDLHDPESHRVGEIDVIVAMQRQGPTGTVVLGWQGHYGRCTCLAKEPE